MTPCMPALLLWRLHSGSIEYVSGAEPYAASPSPAVCATMR